MRVVWEDSQSSCPSLLESFWDHCSSIRTILYRSMSLTLKKLSAVPKWNIHVCTLISAPYFAFWLSFFQSLCNTFHGKKESDHENIVYSLLEPLLKKTVVDDRSVAVPALAADKIGEFAASGIIFKDSVQIMAIDDPEVKGVTIYISGDSHACQLHYSLTAS